MFRFFTLPRMALAFCTLAAASAAAHAAAFTIDDTLADPGPLVISANDWEEGLYIDGSLFQIGLGNPAVGSIASEALTFNGQWIDEGGTGALTRTVYFVEPGTVDEISDILRYTLGTDGFYGYLSGSFTSDSGPGSLGTVPADTDPANIWIEGSGDFQFGAPFLSASVVTPEPTSILLLIVGGGAALIRRRGA